MNIIGLGLGPSATLTGFLLVGLAVSPTEVGSPGSGSPETCESLIAYDFTAASPPLYSVANQPGFWRNPDWLPAGASSDPVEVGFPNLLMARNADISGGELTYIDDPTFAIAVFGEFTGVLETDAYFIDQIDLGINQLNKVYAEVGVDFEKALWDAAALDTRHIVRCYSEGLTRASFEIVPVDADGPPSGTIEFRINWVSDAGIYSSASIKTVPRTFADGVHTFRVEMTPSTPVVPGSTTNHNINFDGTIRVYIDGVLEYENLAAKWRPRHGFETQVNDAFFIGHAVGLGHNGFVGGYTYVDFGICTTGDDLPIDPIEPIPGGELPTPIEPPEDTPGQPMRIFGLLTYWSGPLGTDPEMRQIKVAETTFHFDPPEWYGGFGYPWFISVSSITRELSDSLRGVEVTLTVADPERYFRTLATTLNLSGALWEIFLVSDATRYALGEPHRRFAGRIHDHRAMPGFQYEFVLRDVLSDELAMLADAPRIPPGKLTLEQFPGMTRDYENRAIPIAIGEVSDENEVDVDVVHEGLASSPQGVVPLLIVAPSVNLSAFGGVNVDVVAAVLSHGALPPGGIHKGYYNTVDDPYKRIPIPAGAIGTLITWPGVAGWNYVGVAEDYIDYPLPLSDNTHRYTPVFLLASDANVQAFVDGRIQVAFNVFGLTDQADGSGLYYADAPDIYEFLIRNWLYPPHWKTGEYKTTPSFLSGYTIVNATSVIRSRNRLRSFVGGSPGEYPVGFLLGRDGQQQSLRHVLDELCYGVLMEQGFDRHGRILLDVEDVNAEADIALSDLHDIEAGEFMVWIDNGSYRNNVEYYFGRRYLPAVAPLPTPAEGETLPPVNVGRNTEWQYAFRLEHTDAIDANDGKKSQPMVMENFVVRSIEVGQNWAQRNLDRVVGPSPAYDGQRMFSLTTSWAQKPEVCNVELGTVIEIDHLEGLGPSGYEGQRGRVLKITDNLQQGRITFEGRILFGTGSPIGD